MVILGRRGRGDAISRGGARFRQGLRVSYRVVLTGTEMGVELMSALGNDKSGLPFTVVIERSGKLLTKKLGAMSQEQMQVAIEMALE